MEIEGYSNYLIYEDGKVQNKKTKRFLKPSSTRGYLHYTLCKDGKRKIFTSHRLIAIHFIPNPENKREVDHKNRNKGDNRIENLRWVTHLENQQNMGTRCDNTSGIKNISKHTKDGYTYIKAINNKRHIKWFKTIEEAIEYKKEYESRLEHR
jgi:hypothetical protein